jgi:hypothetical protein
MERVGTTVTLQQVFDAFLLHFDGGRTKQLVQHEYNKLVFGKGACKDLPSTDTEFDRLVGLLFPGAELTEAGNAMLANKYSEILREGNMELWEKTLEKNPHTLAEWKAEAQTAFTVMEIKAKAAKQNPPRGSFRNYQSSSSSPSTSSHGQAASSVSVHQLQHEGDDAKLTWERQEGEPVSPEELQEFKAKNVRKVPKPSRSGSGSAVRSTSTYRAHLKDDLQDQLGALGKCFLCYKHGHIGPQCPDKAKYKDVSNRRQPTSAELKA